LTPINPEKQAIFHQSLPRKRKVKKEEKREREVHVRKGGWARGDGFVGGQDGQGKDVKKTMIDGRQATRTKSRTEPSETGKKTSGNRQ